MFLLYSSSFRSPLLDKLWWHIISTTSHLIKTSLFFKVLVFPFTQHRQRTRYFSVQIKRWKTTNWSSKGFYSFTRRIPMNESFPTKDLRDEKLQSFHDLSNIMPCFSMGTMEAQSHACWLIKMQLKSDWTFIQQSSKQNCFRFYF